MKGKRRKRPKCLAAIEMFEVDAFEMLAQHPNLLYLNANNFTRRRPRHASAMTS
jgi:hypothetical protein